MKLLLVMCVKLTLAVQAAAANQLSCNIVGEPNPLAPTDMQVFKGSDVWVKLGIDRQIGGIAVLLDLAASSRPASSISILDARSAGGAAWQTTLMVLDRESHRRINYNQAAGNSDQVWGYGSNFEMSHGFSQQEWLPLFSNDYREGESLMARDIQTSPCLGNSTKLGDGRTTLVPTTIRTPRGDVIRLTDSYFVRAGSAQDWQWLRADQALYLDRATARAADLRVYYAALGQPVVGPIRGYNAFAGMPTSQVRNQRCREDDCFFSTNPISYAVLVWRVGGIDLAIAIHPPKGLTFTGFLRLRPHLVCRTGQDNCGNLQWHSAIVDSEFDPTTKVRFKVGEIADYHLMYDFGTPEQLASLGFPLNR